MIDCTFFCFQGEEDCIGGEARVLSCSDGVDSVGPSSTAGRTVHGKAVDGADSRWLCHS